MNPQDLLVRYKEALKAQRSGSITREEIRSEFQGLEARDVAGRRWAVDAEAGELLSFDEIAERWRPVGPLPPAGESPAAPEGSPAPPEESLATPEESRAQPTEPPIPILQFFSRLQEEHNWVLAGLVVFAACAVVSWLAWDVLGIPPRTLRGLVTPGFCRSLTPGSWEMFWCSMKVSAQVSAGPILIILFMIVFVRPLTRVAARLVRRLPEELHFLSGPMLATAVFTVMWAAAHYETATGLKGFLSQRTFPAVIGLFTYATMRHGAELQHHLEGLFRLRDRIPKVLRFLVVLAVPFALSLAITFPQKENWLAHPVLTEQLVVIVTLSTGYVLLAPRLRMRPANGGDPAGSGSGAGK